MSDRKINKIQTIRASTFAIRTSPCKSQIFQNSLSAPQRRQKKQQNANKDS